MLNPGRAFYPLLILFLLLNQALPAFSQTYLRGKVIFEKDNKPAPYASVELMEQKSGGCTDQAGWFSIPVSSEDKQDTLRISMVGYETLKVPVKIALKKKRVHPYTKSYQHGKRDRKSFLFARCGRVNI